MNKNSIKIFKKNLCFHKKGATLISVLILSLLVMSLILGASRIIGQKMEFTTDFLFGEKSYFAAESGTEKALLILKKTPLKHGKISTKFLSKDETNIHVFIENRKKIFSFLLPAFENRKLRLQKNTDKNIYKAVNLDSIKITATSKSQYFGDLFQWSIQCTKENSKHRTTISIQGNSTEIFDQEIINFIGNYDNARGETQTLFPVSTFWDTEISSNERNSCFLSIENLTEFPVHVLIKSDGMAPDKARITSQGVARDREKTIQFEYLQNNLSSFFSFGFLHTDVNEEVFEEIENFLEKE